MTGPVRTRFAPSPTGELHIGGLRTALFQWAFVQANGGELILRIEDTDQSRYVEGSVENIYEGLRWLGIEWAEGPDVGGPHGPYTQSERLEKYHAVADELRARGRAYRCFCTSERLAQLRKDQQKDGLAPGYDGRCRAVDPGEADERARSGPSVLRFRMDRTGVTTFPDLIRGEVTFQNSLQDDFVILKTDGFPTYHLAMLVDDHDMEITHVIRAEEWLASGPRHSTYERHEWPPPTFAIPCSSTGRPQALEGFGEWRPRLPRRGYLTRRRCLNVLAFRLVAR